MLKKNVPAVIQFVQVDRLVSYPFVFIHLRFEAFLWITQLYTLELGVRSKQLIVERHAPLQVTHDSPIVLSQYLETEVS